MSRRTVIIVAAALVVGAVGAVAAAAGLQEPNDSLGSDARRPRVPPGYNFKAEFGLGLEVKWEENTGSRAGPCPSWTHTKGKLEIDAGSVDTKKTRFTIPGRMSIFSQRQRDRQNNWADPTTAGLGAARATIKPSFPVREGRVCVDGVSKPWQPPPNDCGEKRYVSRVASVRPAFRSSFETLDQLIGLRNRPPRRSDLSGFSLEALVIDIPPTPGAVYRSCQLPLGLSAYPVGIAINLNENNISKLKALRPGESFRLRTPPKSIKTYAGPCGEEIVAENCTFELEIFVDIRRWKPGEPWP
jgi:hypothetical protein